jgi:hypothetical protein
MDYTWALNQICVYWKRLAPDGHGGYLWEDPVELVCRWEIKQELISDAQGRQITSNAKILLNQDVVVGDFLYLGDLDDITSSSGSPGSMDQAYEVKRFDKIPDIPAEEFTRWAWL